MPTKNISSCYKNMALQITCNVIVLCIKDKKELYFQDCNRL